ncbi:alpha/beta hydrolase [Aliiglaciecola sp. M165]|uniref:alpha/beta fold hydrolase n=1 Tax=Aliiglaciecola sp. M165 TaxID=2593649 RepID=UPI0028C3EEC0|nr:alpha/beta hydrolase [Aliiglaciecola sp. M165]
MLNKAAIFRRNNVVIAGSGETTLMLAHGFGCDQNMWNHLIPELSGHYRIILFDYVGSGKSDLTQYSQARYSSLEGYAQDVIDVCEAVELENIVFVGHSVSATIGLLASIKAPQLFSKMVMVCPSPCFLNDPPTYHGGFEKEDLEELLNLMDKNYIGWANYLAPLVVGVSNPAPILSALNESFCSTDPVVAKTFARATFFSDYRHKLSSACHPTLIFQSENDALASVKVGKYVHENIADSKFEIIEAEGHCLHMTHPEQVANSIKAFTK